MAYAARAAASLAPLVANRAPAERIFAATEAAYGDEAPRAVRATSMRLGGVLAALRSEHDEAAERFGIALAAARSLGYIPWVAEILVDYAASLVADDRAAEAEPLVAEARTIAEELGWNRLLDRISALPAAPAEATVR